MVECCHHAITREMKRKERSKDERLVMNCELHDQKPKHYLHDQLLLSLLVVIDMVACTTGLV